ncbi:MAG: DJ-1/PfpI family protein [Clostridiales bacterium]|nr:DJ-1/PfpI family protein [Clostridiales bacterium]
MKKIYAMIAEGTEECELLNVVDIARRAALDVEIVSVSGKTVTTSHGVVITADKTIDEVNLTECDLLFIPGGMPGSKNLAACGKLVSAVGDMLKKGKRVAAICAAPALVLAEHGFLEGKKATCFPSFEDRMCGAVVTKGRVETDGLITTARGLGCSIELGLEIVSLLCGEALSAEVRQKIVF